MSERAITRRLDFEELRRTIERREADLLLGFYAEDAELRVVNAQAPESPPFELRGKADIARYLRAVYSRPAVHRVHNEVVGEGWILFEESCEYSDGASDVVVTRLEVLGGKVSRQLDVVTGRGERAGGSFEPPDGKEPDR